jgi:hypothetical protein
MQKTSINIDDLTHSMASDVSTVANNWDGFWPSTDTKDTKAAVDQNSTRYLPCDSLEQGYAVERSFARSYTPQTWQVQPRECQQTHSRKQKAQKAQRCCRETVWRNDKMFHTSVGSEIPCQFISMNRSRPNATRFASSSPEGTSSRYKPEGHRTSELRESGALCVSHRDYQPPCNQGPHSLRVVSCTCEPA